MLMWLLKTYESWTDVDTVNKTKEENNCSTWRVVLYAKALSRLKQVLVKLNLITCQEIFNQLHKIRWRIDLNIKFKVPKCLSQGFTCFESDIHHSNYINSEESFCWCWSNLKKQVWHDYCIITFSVPIMSCRNILCIVSA